MVYESLEVFDDKDETIVTVEDFKEQYKEEVASLFAEVFSEPPWNEELEESYVEEIIEEDLEKEGSEFLVAKRCLESLDSEGRLVGFTWAVPSIDSEMELLNSERELYISEDTAYLSELGVKPGAFPEDPEFVESYQCKGIGRKLTEEFLGKLSESYNEVALRTSDNAEKAMNLYRDLGFEETGIYDKNHHERQYLVKRLDGYEG